MGIEKQKNRTAPTDIDKENLCTLILHNDDYHTFDYVIESLIEICELDAIQATQCTYLIHYKGKCDVKRGSKSFLLPMRRALAKRDLKAVIS
ncbi:MAG: ATP-dependent Clp protease adaptor ClpS [Bacteroidia bacterium]|nr:ATP-dependent Clp protease adaptor ClpS [Bacteroidia bacterium]